MAHKYYRLKYTDKSEAIADLVSKNILVEEEGEHIKTPGTSMVKFLQIPDQVGTYDEEGNELTPTTFIEGAHVDVISTQELDFEDKLVTNINTPYHTVAGW